MKQKMEKNIFFLKKGNKKKIFLRGSKKIPNKLKFEKFKKINKLKKLLTGY